MMQLIEELYLTNRGFVTDDYEHCLEYIDQQELPLTYHTYPSGEEVWDSWVVPKKWSVNEATLETTDGTVLVDFNDHPLHLISYSDSYEGYISREELLDHLHWHPDNDEAIPWHYAQNYQPWDSEWGFCVPRTLVESLDDDEYYVNIDTSFEPGTMTVAEHHLQGQRDETIVLVAHLDHTGMANDDLSGVAGGIELMRRLRDRSELTYSYKLLIVQEILGSAAYLADESTPDQFMCGVFLEMLGNDNRLLLQRSFEGETPLDQAAQHVLKHTRHDHEVAGFREQIGNDESVFESPGFEIPMISISRYPYPEYHTHFDDPSILSQARLETAVEVVLETLLLLENNIVPTRNFEGLPSLANPKYDLYLEPKEVVKRYDDVDPAAVELFRDRIFRYLEGEHPTLDLAERFDLPFAFVTDYVHELADVGLVTLEQATHDNTPKH
jgi:aminopeptidase-like protein